jgi:hypothetical protein
MNSHRRRRFRRHVTSHFSPQRYHGPNVICPTVEVINVASPRCIGSGHSGVWS